MCSMLAPTTKEIGEAFFLPQDKESWFESSWIKTMKDEDAQGYKFFIDPSSTKVRGSPNYESTQKIASIVKIEAR